MLVVVSNRNRRLMAREEEGEGQMGAESGEWATEKDGQPTPELPMVGPEPGTAVLLRVGPAGVGDSGGGQCDARVLARQVVAGLPDVAVKNIDDQKYIFISLMLIFRIHLEILFNSFIFQSVYQL
jgi:hypothetical protein